MDWEEYLANLESADEQNYWVTDIDVTHSEYIKKSDVLRILADINPCNGTGWDDAHYNSGKEHMSEDSIDSVSALPTINPYQVIDEMIEELEKAHPFAIRYWGDEKYKSSISILQELKQRLSSNK